ncbi:MAG: RnfABCDGE type electron transport complex subunit B [Betaproteobacteria bacterium]
MGPTFAASMVMPDPAVVDAVLPQTQCTQCGYAGCLPYAEAIAAGSAGINQCPPGGDAGIHALAAATGLPYLPLNPAHGEHKPRLLAVIDETQCIGCTICIQKCPVDAIVGAAKLMHTVIATECTGCELCVAPCPVDCIALVPAPDSHPARMHAHVAADLARTRHRSRLERLRRIAGKRAGNKTAAPAPGVADAVAVAPAVGSAEHRQAAVTAALARARARREPAGLA